MWQFLLLWVGAAALSGSAAATTVVLDFEGLIGSADRIDGFYAGGSSANGAGPGPDYGILQSGFGGISGIISTPDSNAPSGLRVMSFFSFQPIEAGLYVESGFSGAVSFSYASVVDDMLVSIFSGPGPSGVEIASIDLAATGNSLPASFVPVTLSFPGVATEIRFEQPLGFIGTSRFDDLSLQLVPEPTTDLLLAGGIASLAAARRGREPA